MENSEVEDENVPPEPPVKEVHRWVLWKVETWEMPSWWRGLVAVPEVGDHNRLAWEVWASFWLPRRMSELHQMDDCCQTPPALPCLLWKKFIPPTSSTPSMPARIFGRYHRRRWWHMLEPSSIGWRKLTSMLEGSHAC